MVVTHQIDNRFQVEVGVINESFYIILENLLHTEQCLDRSGFCIMHEEQKESLKN